MIRLTSLFVLLVALAAGSVLAQEELDTPAPEMLAIQNLAIARAVQDQLLACWSLPSGYEGRVISVRLAFLGDGTLDSEPYIEPDSLRTAGKYPAFMQSIVRAIQTCLPFEGLEALGALPGERFDITVHFQS